MSLVKRPVVVLALIDSGGGADQICLRLSGIGWGCSPPLLFAHDRAVHSPRLLAAPSLPRGNEELAMVRRSQELIFLSCRSRHRFSLSLPPPSAPFCFLCLGSDLGRAQRSSVAEMCWICSCKWHLGEVEHPQISFLAFFVPFLCSFTPKGEEKEKDCMGSHTAM